MAMLMQSAGEEICFSNKRRFLAFQRYHKIQGYSDVKFNPVVGKGIQVFAFWRSVFMEGEMIALGPLMIGANAQTSAAKGQSTKA